MAKLVSVIRSEEYLFGRRQLPLQCDDTLSLVMQLDDTCMGCSKESLKRKELERFVAKFHALSSDELAVALMVSSKDILALLQQMVPCVGCRRSVERLLKQLQSSGHAALEPLIVTSNGSVSIKREYLFDPKAVFALFYIHGCKMVDVMDSIPKSKKNKRCNLHSLDTHTHKTRTLGIWEDAWALLSPECREEIVLIDFDGLMTTLDGYLRKHRFCTECKAKVLRAYDILIGEVEAKTEKGYLATLYDGLRCCQQERHIHVSSHTDYIAFLITRAEPELTGSRRERHAKTLDIAQEEVLTCLGIHLYERLYKIQQKLKAEEQTWQILLYLGMEALRKSFDVALETKQGRSNLELMCEELLLEEQAKEQKRENKRQKKKKKKNNNTTSNGSPHSNKKGAGNDTTTTTPSSNKTLQLNTITPEKDCKCDENTNVESTPCHSCDENHAPQPSHCAFQPSTPANKASRLGRDCSGSSKTIGGCSGDKIGGGGSEGICGGHSPKSSSIYCGSGDVTTYNKSSSAASSCYAYDAQTKASSTCDHQPVPVSPLSHNNHPGHHHHHHHHSNEKLSKHPSNGHHAGGGGQHSNMGDVGYVSEQECGSCSSNASSRDGSDVACQEGFCNHDGDSVLCAKPDLLPFSVRSCGHGEAGHQAGGGLFSLQDMLEEPCCSGDEEDEGAGISEEEIKQFRANQQRVRDQRDRLRQVLRQRFANMQTRIKACACDDDNHCQH